MKNKNNAMQLNHLQFPVQILKLAQKTSISQIHTYTHADSTIGHFIILTGQWPPTQPALEKKKTLTEKTPCAKASKT